MTAREKLKAEELKRFIIIEQNNKCYVCGKEFNFNNIPQIAHRIPKYDRYVKKEGAKVIHHRFNLRATCKNCNSYVSVGYNTLQGKALIEEIKRDILAKS